MGGLAADIHHGPIHRWDTVPDCDSAGSTGTRAPSASGPLYNHTAVSRANQRAASESARNRVRRGPRTRTTRAKPCRPHRTAAVQGGCSPSRSSSDSKCSNVAFVRGVRRKSSNDMPDAPPFRLLPVRTGECSRWLAMVRGPRPSDIERVDWGSTGGRSTKVPRRRPPPPGLRVCTAGLSACRPWEVRRRRISGVDVHR